MKLDPLAFAPNTQLPTLKQPQEDDPAALREAAHGFESLLVNEMFKAMRRAGQMTEQSFGEGVFTAMLDERIAQTMAEAGTFGLSDALTEQFVPPDTQEKAQHVDAQLGTKRPLITKGGKP